MQDATVTDARQMLDTFREWLKKNAATMVVRNESGPVGMQVVDAFMLAIESLDKRVAALEKGPRAA